MSAQGGTPSNSPWCANCKLSGHWELQCFEATRSRAPVSQSTPLDHQLASGPIVQTYARAQSSSTMPPHRMMGPEGASTYSAPAYTAPTYPFPSAVPHHHPAYPYPAYGAHGHVAPIAMSSMSHSHMPPVPPVAQRANFHGSSGHPHHHHNPHQRAHTSKPLPPAPSSLPAKPPSLPAKPPVSMAPPTSGTAAVVAKGGHDNNKNRNNNNRHGNKQWKKPEQPKKKGPSVTTSAKAPTVATATATATTGKTPNAEVEEGEISSALHTAVHAPFSYDVPKPTIEGNDRDEGEIEDDHPTVFKKPKQAPWRQSPGERRQAPRESSPLTSRNSQSGSPALSKRPSHNTGRNSPSRTPTPLHGGPNDRRLSATYCDSASRTSTPSVSRPGISGAAGRSMAHQNGVSKRPQQRRSSPGGYKRGDASRDSSANSTSSQRSHSPGMSVERDMQRREGDDIKRKLDHLEGEDLTDLECMLLGRRYRSRADHKAALEMRQRALQRNRRTEDPVYGRR